MRSDTHIFGTLLAGIEIPPNRFPVVIGLLTGGTLIYYLLQLLAYGTIGYVFTDATGASQWLKGFQRHAGASRIPASCPLSPCSFYPAAALSLISISALLYILARIVFICKGFRIFTTIFHPCFTFILYLLHRGNNSGVVSVPGRIFTMSFIIKLANPHKPLKE